MEQGIVEACKGGKGDGKLMEQGVLEVINIHVREKEHQE